MIEAKDHDWAAGCACRPKAEATDRGAGGRAGWWAAYGELVLALGSGALTAAAWALQAFGAGAEAVVPLFLLAYAVGGYHKARAGLSLLFHQKKLGVDVLMILAAAAAAATGYWTEGAVLIFIFAMSGALETMTLARSRRDLSRLLSLQPETATRLVDGREEIVPIDALDVDDVVLVRPGETVPIDGVVLEGTSSVNQAAITGEAVPVDKAPGDAVYAGTQNTHGALKIRVTQRAEGTLFAKIVRLVREAEESMPPTQRFIDRVEGAYVYGVLAVTILLIVALPTVFHLSWTAALYKAIVFMVVASPCAVVASITPAILAAMSNGARNGLLLKGGAYLESLGRAKVVAFDKTGTITAGRHEVTDVLVADDVDRREWLSRVASAERLSEHPIARAIVAYAEREGVPLFEVDNLEAHAGLGVTVRLGERVLRIGSVVWIGLPDDHPWRAAIRDMEKEGKTFALVEEDGRPTGLIALRDVIRPEAKEAIAALRAMDVRVAMLTGDHRTPAEAIAREVGIDLVYAELLPDDKARIVDELRRKHGTVVMVGDGINDAPALARATVGVAMGAAGSDIALETADVVLMNDQLAKLVHAVRLGRRTERIIKQNLTFAAGVIVLLIAVNFGAALPLPLGVVGHEGSTILVILNALRLLRG
ncbi:heavy metal translocating P-type ATPase [Hydrogenibacillus schlegelii]|uniref:heavy metal translocating P-type ATPase n=1 Tax=Hydrogenibacillus schlegelii TaxID=1484 RepID=UPI0009E76C82|nr:heavy metal translocating P-type ATPase [Hydrogenibacillus schlegelii]